MVVGGVLIALRSIRALMKVDETSADAAYYQLQRPHAIT